MGSGRMIGAARLGWALVLGLPALVILASPQGFQVVFLLAGLLAAPAAIVEARRTGFGSPNLLVGALAATLAWSVAALIWTDDVGRGAAHVAGAVAIALFALALARAASPMRADASVAVWISGHRQALVWGLALAIALGILDLLTEGGVQHVLRPGLDWRVYDVNRLSAVTALFIWPALFASRTMLGRISLLAGAMALIVLGDSQAAMLAMTAGGVVLGICQMSRRATTVVIAVVVAGIVAAPWAASNVAALLPDRVVALLPTNTGLIRLQIWEAAAALWQTAPLRGLGLEAIRDEVLPSLAASYPEMRVNHPHNAWVQVALDLGLVGSALLAALTLAIARLGAGAHLAPLHMATLTAASAVLAISWSLWATWWLATLAALVLACVFVERDAGRA